MRAATEQEFARAIAHMTAKRIMQTKRTMDVFYSSNGVEIAHKTIIYKRGKINQILYYVAAKEGEI